MGTGPSVALREQEPSVAPGNETCLCGPVHESWLHRLSATTIALSLFLAMIALWVGFYRVGRRLSGPDGKTELGPIDEFVGILIALVLAFGLALSYERFDAHGKAIVDEGSAIANCDFTCDLLSEPRREQCHSLIRRYARLRLEMYDIDLNEVGPVVQQSEALHDQLWGLVRDSVAERDTPSMTLVVAAIKNVLDAHDARLVSRAQVVPGPMVIVILLLCLFWSAFSGYSYGLKSNHRSYAWVGFAFAVAVVVFLILDLDRPTSGFIRARQAQGMMMEQLRSMEPERL